MKLIYLIFLLPFLLACSENPDFSKIENLINQNSSELIKDAKSSISAEDKKAALKFATKIQSGECPSGINEKLKSYTIKNLASKKIDNKIAKEVIDCIRKIGIEQHQDFTLMIDLLAFWNDKNPMLELFYSEFFKSYKKPNPKTLGLLDNAKLMCANAAIQFLENDNYPKNYEKTMTDKEYALFLKYIKLYRCSGYSG